MESQKKVDRNSYNIVYKDRVSNLGRVKNIEEYLKEYERINLSPFFAGGTTKGYIRGLSVKLLVEEAKKLNRSFDKIIVLDAGCGQGELSVYLACLGFTVVGVDISEEACISSKKLAEGIKVNHLCSFIAESLEDIRSVKDGSIDFIIGHAALHHFIKYDVAPEFKRIMKPVAKGFFADSFGENKLYHLFHNKEKMELLGDVILTKKLIENYFSGFKIELIPVDWFSMSDKIFEKILSPNVARKIGFFNYKVDRLIPRKSRLSLYFSGSVLTIICKS